MKILVFLFFSFNLLAQTLDGIYYDWSVFILDNAGEEKKCYIASFPKKSIGNFTKKREPYILITRFNEKKVEEISVYSGFEYKISGKVFIMIDEKQFILWTKEDVAWTKTKEEDKQIIKTLLNSTTLKIRAESSNMEYVVDDYSLKGFVRAYKRMKELCDN
jgi:phage pi2 protein 07